MFIGAYVARRFYRIELDQYKTTLIQAQLKAAAYKTAAKRHVAVKDLVVETKKEWSPDEPTLP